jgi:hypothetical protein
MMFLHTLLPTYLIFKQFDKCGVVHFVNFKTLNNTVIHGFKYTGFNQSILINTLVKIPISRVHFVMALYVFIIVVVLFALCFSYYSLTKLY